MKPYLRAYCLSLGAFLFATSSAEATSVLNDVILPGREIALEQVAVVSGPNSLGHAGDGSGRLFVNSQQGKIRVIQDDILRPEPFLDVVTAGVPLIPRGEQGLLGFAFHPNFAAPQTTPGSGLLYTHTSEQSVGTPDFDHPELVASGGGSHHSVIREWSVSPTDPGRVDITRPSRVLMRVNQPQSNHNGGDLAFGLDENLYISLGDGGGGNDNLPRANANDGHTDGIGNSQDLSNVYGTILRVNPLGDNAGEYGVPTDNPFVASDGVDEIYAYGLRNPFRISFDRETGDLYAGDVGQSSREEIDRILSGANYGWAFEEGTRQNFAGGPTETEAPVGEYSRSGGAAVIGGFVYRGSKIVGLRGTYVFGDLGGGAAGGLYYLDLDTGEIRAFTLAPGSAAAPRRLFGLGEDEAGELYYLFGSGEVMRILAPEPSSAALLALGLIALARRMPRPRRPGAQRHPPG